MAGTNLGSAYVTIMPSAKGMGGALSKEMGAAGTESGGIAGKNFVGALKGIIAGAAIGKFFKDAINLGGELQQNLGGTQAVFGEFAQTIEAQAEEAYKNMGLSASDYMATANKMGSLFQGSGVEQRRSLELTTAAMQRASDVASVMGISQEMAMESIAGAAKGNFTMMDNLGVAMNATTLSAYALEKGVNFKWNTATNAEKAELAMQMFMDRTSQYEGNFARESEETFTGSIGAMKAAAENFMANLALGRDIKKPLGEMLDTAATFLTKNLLPMIGKILSAIPSAVGEILKKAFSNLPGAVEGVKDFLNGVTESIRNGSGDILGAVGEVLSVVWEGIVNTDWVGLFESLAELIWTAITTAAPIIWEGILALGESAKEWFMSVDWGMVGQTVVQLIGDGIGAVGELLWEGIQALASTAVEWWKGIDWSTAGSDAFHLLVDGLVLVGSALWEALKTIAQTAAEHFKNTDVDWGEVGRTVLTMIGNGIGAVGQFIWEGLATIGRNASEAFKNIDWNNAGYTAMNAIINGIAALGHALWEGLKALGRGAAEGFKNINWREVGIAVVRFIGQGIVAIGQFIWGCLRSIGEHAWEGIKNMEWFQVGMDIVYGIADGIARVGGVIWETLQSMAQSAWQGILDFFGINSPSKLMRDTVGKYIPLGIAAGIEQEAGSVTDAMDAMAADASTAIETDFAYSAAQGAYAGEVAAGDENIINVYPSPGMDERALADMVQQRLALLQRQKQAAWGTA